MTKRKEIEASDLDGLTSEEINEILSKKGNYIQFIQNPTEEQAILAVRQNGYAIRHIKNQTESIVNAAIARQPLSIQFVKKPTRDQLERCFEKDPNTIAYIKNPSYEQKISAVSRKGGTIQYISDPDQYLVGLAIDNNPMSLQHVYKKMTDEEIITVLKRRPQAIKNILDKLSPEIKKMVLSNYGFCLKYLKRQTEELCLLAVKNNPLAIKFVQNQTSAIKKLVIDSRNSEAINFLDVSDEDTSKYLVKKKPGAIKQLKNPAKEVIDTYNTAVLQRDKIARKEKVNLNFDPKDGYTYERELQSIIQRISDGAPMCVNVIDNKIPLYRIINYLVKAINPTEANIAVGYLFESGLGMLKDSFRLLYDRGVKTNITVGSLQHYYDNLENRTYVEEMDIGTARLLNKFLKSGLISLSTYENTFYHGKFFWFSGENVSFMILGSSNISASGLRRNRELNTLYIFNKRNEIVSKHIEWYNTLKSETITIEKLDECCFSQKEENNDLPAYEMNIHDIRSAVNALTDKEQQERLNLWLSKSPSKVYKMKETMTKAFDGYIVIEYHRENLCVLESLQPGNAFYCFNTGNFDVLREDICKKTKVQLFQHKLLLKRGYHCSDTFTLMLSINDLFQEI